MAEDAEKTRKNDIFANISKSKRFKPIIVLLKVEHKLGSSEHFDTNFSLIRHSYPELDHICEFWL